MKIKPAPDAKNKTKAERIAKDIHAIMGRQVEVIWVQENFDTWRVVFRVFWSDGDYSAVTADETTLHEEDECSFIRDLCEVFKLLRGAPAGDYRGRQFFVSVKSRGRSVDANRQSEVTDL